MSPANRQAAYVKSREMPSFSFKWANWFIPLLIGCATLFWIEDHLNNPSTLPVNKIRVHGAFINVDEAMLHRAVNGVVAGGYFNVDVGRVREVVENLPWVSEASVRRVWPDTLSVSVVEQRPVAVTKKSGLVNEKGEVFKPSNNKYSAALPVFDGDINLSRMMLAKYYEMSDLLLNIKQKIVYLKIDARHAVEIKLENGLGVVLGREDTMNRLERFTRVYNKVLSARVNDIDVIDLRYTNGMAIRWKKHLKSKGTLGDMNHV